MLPGYASWAHHLAPAAPVASVGPVTVGTILTTKEQIAALPVGSVIAYGTKSVSKVGIAFYRHVATGEWMLTNFGSELLGEPMLLSELVASSDEWGAVVIRVGADADLDPFYAHLMVTAGKSSSALFVNIPLGA
jgi:hypothetical protein